MTDFIDTLFATLEERKANPSPDSYTSSLLEAGENAIAQKVGEEAVEVVVAALGQTNERLVEETADLVYHTLVLLVSRGLSWDDIRQELEKRHKK